MSDEQHNAHGGLPRALLPFFASMQERALALGSLRDEKPEKQVELLAFHVGKETFAIDVAAIIEVVRLSRHFPLPQVGPEVLGIMSLRGAMVPLLDLGRLMGVLAAIGADVPPQKRSTHARYEPGKRVIVLKDIAPLGLVVERVLGVVRVRASSLAAAPPQGQGLLLGLSHGTLHGTLRVLDAQALLARCARLS